MEISNIEKTRKRLFALLCASFCIPVILLFTIINAIEGDTIEVVINIITAIIFIVSFYVVKKYNADLFVYRLILAMLSAAYLYHVSIGSGDGTIVYWLFAFPLVFVFFLGKTEGSFAFVIFFSILSILLINPFSVDIYSYNTKGAVRFLMSFLLVGLIAYGLEASREKYANLLIEKHERLNKEKQNLERALSEVKTLSGLIPICSNCKKIRDDKGYWQQVDTYVRNHTSADFSHGICPDCFKKLYPELKRTEK